MDSQAARLAGLLHTAAVGMTRPSPTAWEDASANLAEAVEILRTAGHLAHYPALPADVTVLKQVLEQAARLRFQSDMESEPAYSATGQAVRLRGQNWAVDG